MTKKEALLKLKVTFRNPNLSTYRLKEVRDLYSEIKGLTISDNTSVSKDLEYKVKSM